VSKVGVMMRDVLVLMFILSYHIISYSFKKTFSKRKVRNV